MKMFGKNGRAVFGLHFRWMELAYHKRRAGAGQNLKADPFVAGSGQIDFGGGSGWTLSNNANSLCLGPYVPVGHCHRGERHYENYITKSDHLGSFQKESSSPSVRSCHQLRQWLIIFRGCLVGIPPTSFHQALQESNLPVLAP